MDNRQRLLSTLDREISGNPPVICPGGMMSMVCKDVKWKSSPDWLQAHINPATMAKVAMYLQETTGFENLGVPFCVTVEAEALGGNIDLGDSNVEPRIVDYVLNSPGALNKLKIDGANFNRRMSVVLEAISILKHERKDIPIIGNLTGPISLATSIMDPNLFLRLLIKDKPFIHDLLDFSTEVIASFGEAQARAGADVISIGDPTASGEILGPESFEEFVLPALQQIIKRIKRQKARTILHICGNIKSILKYLKQTGADALSFDASMSIKVVKGTAGDWVFMGNVSTFLLARGPHSSIARASRKVIDNGIDIVSPACGLSTGTPVKNVRTMTDAVRSYREERGKTI